MNLMRGKPAQKRNFDLGIAVFLIFLSFDFILKDTRIRDSAPPNPAWHSCGRFLRVNSAVWSTRLQLLTGCFGWRAPTVLD